MSFLDDGAFLTMSEYIAALDETIVQRSGLISDLGCLIASTVVVTAVDFIPHNREIAFRRIQRVGLPGKSGRGHLYLCLHLTRRASPREAEMLLGIFIIRRLSGRFPNHLEAHSRGVGNRVEGRPVRLVHNRHVLHLERIGVSAGRDGQAAFGNGNRPVQSRWRNRGMKIVDLVFGNRRSPEQR
jgi:hypothetical protein